MAPPYTWLSQANAINQFQERLSDTGQLWTLLELGIYLEEALRVYNALTEQWKIDYTFDTQGSQWVNLGTAALSPRLRTVNDGEIYTQMQYMLFEQPSGAGTWTGTNQFDLDDLTQALSNRRNETIQSSACNLMNAPFATTPGTRRTLLPDNLLESRRIRFLGVVANTTGTAASGSTSMTVATIAGITVGCIVTGTNLQVGTVVTAISGLTLTLSLATTGIMSAAPIQFAFPMTLTREDTQGFQYFEPFYLQTDQTPQSWSVASEPPLAFDVDTAPSGAGSYDYIGLQSGPAFAPPAVNLLGVPDDWSWVPMYGALHDVLSSEPESTDRQRAAYCLKRYQDGLQMMQTGNWLVQAAITGVPCDTPSLYEKDVWSPEWQSLGVLSPCVVQGGIDFVCAAPGTPQTVTLTLVQNAPILVGGSYQISRDDWDSVLDYAQHLACFKLGGNSFLSTLPLLDNFIAACARTNKRLLTYGLYADILNSQGLREDREVPRA